MKIYKIITWMIMISLLALSSGCKSKSQLGEKNLDKQYEVIWYDLAPTTSDHDLVMEAVNTYTLEKIGTKIDYRPIVGSEYNSKLQMILASNENFDMCFTNNTNFLTNVLGQAYLQIDDLLDKYAKEAKELVPEYAYKGAKVDGKLYAYPAYKDYAQDHVFYYRSDLAKKYSFNMGSVKKLSDFEPLLAQIKQNEKDIYPMTFLSTISPFNMLPFDIISGGVVGAVRVDTDDGKIINPYESPEALEYFKTVHYFYTKGYLRSDIATITSNADIKNTVFLNVEQELPYLINQRNATLKNPYAVLNMSKPLLSTTCIQGSMVAISRTSKNPEKTMQFINILNTDKYVRNLFAYGTEGKHYIKADENHYKLPQGVAKLSDTGYHSYVYTQGNKYLTMMIEGTPNDIYQKYQEFDSNAVKSPALGFMFNSEKVTNECSAVQNVYNEFMPALITGAADPNEFLPKAIEKFKTAGLDTILNEMQKQYDEWKKLQ